MVYGVRLKGKRCGAAWSQPGYLTHAGDGERVGWTNDCRRASVVLFDSREQARVMCALPVLRCYVTEVVDCPDHSTPLTVVT